MKPLTTARDVLARQMRALWSWGQRGGDAARTASIGLGAGEPDRAPAPAGTGFTPAQDLGFFARSASWRCVACGKVHEFAEQVPVVMASPCVCTGIEFVPQRDGLFKPAEMLAGEAPPLLT